MSEEKKTVSKKEVQNKLGLVFKSNGWCAELGKGYRKGAYTCKNQKEFDALKKHAVK